MKSQLPGFAEAALDVAGLGSGRALVHALSLGRVRVEIPPLLPGARAPLIARFPDGSFAVHPTLAEVFGVTFWIAVFVAAVVLYPDIRLR
jgi:hypothetical protein